MEISKDVPNKILKIKLTRVPAIPFLGVDFKGLISEHATKTPMLHVHWSSIQNSSLMDSLDIYWRNNTGNVACIYTHTTSSYIYTHTFIQPRRTKLCHFQGNRWNWKSSHEANKPGSERQNHTSLHVWNLDFFKGSREGQRVLLREWEDSGKGTRVHGKEYNQSTFMRAGPTSHGDLLSSLPTFWVQFFLLLLCLFPLDAAQNLHLHFPELWASLILLHAMWPASMRA